MPHDEHDMNVEHFLAGAPVLLAARRFGSYVRELAGVMWRELHAASRDEQSAGWICLDGWARCEVRGDDSMLRVVDLWRRTGIIGIQRGDTIVDAVSPDDDLADYRIRLARPMAEPDADGDETPRIGTKERLIRFHTEWGDRAADAMRLACAAHGQNAFVEANMAWRHLVAACNTERGHGWITGQKLLSRTPFRREMTQKVVRTFWQEGYVEARRADETGRAFDDGADVTQYDFRLVPAPYPEWE